jgi:hypothetical protein
MGRYFRPGEAVCLVETNEEVVLCGRPWGVAEHGEVLEDGDDLGVDSSECDYRAW